MRENIKTTMSEDGVVVIEGFLTPGEADELRIAGEELEKTRPEQVGVFSATEEKDLMHKDSYFLESNDKIRYFLESRSDGEKARLNKVGHALHWLHPLFRFYTFSNRVKQICMGLGMQDPTVVQSMFIYKSSFTGGEVQPHQDSTYLATDPQTAIGFWIALADTTIENGCLWVAKGSHKSGTHCRMIRNPDKSSKTGLIYDRPAPSYPSSNFTPLTISKGDCILLHGQVVHKSSANKSPTDRPAYTFHVVEKGAKFCEDNWLQEGPEAPFVSLYHTGQSE